MDVELDPAQPQEIEAAVAAALAPVHPGADPWWQAGLAEALEADAGA